MKRLLLFSLIFGAILPLLFGQEEKTDEKKVLISGIVVDYLGKPIKGYPVSLIVEREVLDLSKLTTMVKNRKVFTTETDPDGRYFFTWKPDDYYNRFYINYLVEGKFDDVQFLPPAEPLIDASKAVGKEKNFEHKLVLLYNPSWEKLVKLIEVYGVESDKGRILRANGFFEKETEEEIAGEKFTFWWYYSRGKAYKFTGDKLLKEFAFQPIQPI